MPIKQVLLVRTDLNMRKGKIAAQCAHASLKVFFDRSTVETLHGDTDKPCLVVAPLTPEMVSWIEGVFTKVVLGVETEADLLAVYEAAKAAGLPTALITDMGATEFKKTCPDCPDRKEPPCPTCGGTGKVPNPTRTCVAIGPAEAVAIDLITGPSGIVKVKLL